MLAPYALPENSNPFTMNTGSGSAKGLLAVVALFVTSVVTAPVVVASLLLADSTIGQYVVLTVGLAYGITLAWGGTLAAGAIVDRRGPELLKAVTPRR